MHPLFLAVRGLVTISVYSLCRVSNPAPQIIFWHRLPGRMWGFKPRNFRHQQLPLTYRSASRSPYLNTPLVAYYIPICLGLIGTVHWLPHNWWAMRSNMVNMVKIHFQLHQPNAIIMILPVIRNTTSIPFNHNFVIITAAGLFYWNKFIYHALITSIRRFYSISDSERLKRNVL